MADERLNRYVSRAAGVSRRTADELIRMGRVSVGKAPVLDPGTLFDPGRDEVRLDGNTLAVFDEETEKTYIMLYKPDNVVSTMKDKEGRATVASLIGGLSSRVFPVGRLDYHTTGLLLMTDDGDLSFRLTHPKFGVEKTYVAKVAGVPSPSRLDVLRRGLPIDGVPTNPAHVRFLETREGKSWVSIRIAEGRHHQVRKMFDAIGHRVMKLRRVAIGDLELAGLEPGQWRYLEAKEVKVLKACVAAREKETAWGLRAAPRPAGPRAEASKSLTGERKGPRQPKPEWKKPPRRPPRPAPAAPGKKGRGRKGPRPGGRPKG